MNRKQAQPGSGDGCEVIAHRGASRVSPENTLASVRAAVAAGADACEFDVRATREGHLVLMHDATLDRTTDGEGSLRDVSLEEVRRLDAGTWMGHEFSGERVPTLGEVLGFLRTTSCTAVVDVKEPDLASDVLEQITRAGMLSRGVVICSEPECLRELSAAEPRLRLGLLVDERLASSASERADGLAARARECGARILDLHHSMLDAGLIAALHERGLVVWAWTVNEPDEFAVVRAWGLDGVTTDVPHELQGR